jgi:hypothetical protein
VVTANRVMWSADSARICASGHGHPLASSRRRVAHDHDEDVQSEQHEDRNNAEGSRCPGEVPEQVYADPPVHGEANHAAYRHPGPPAPPVMQPDELGDIR